MMKVPLPDRRADWFPPERPYTATGAGRPERRPNVVFAPGESDDVVLAAVDRAKAAATASGAYIVGRRADELVSG